MEASTGIEPVYTDLQSAASPLRQLAEGAARFRPLRRAGQARIGGEADRNAAANLSRAGCRAVSACVAIPTEPNVVEVSIASSAKRPDVSSGITTPREITQTAA